MRSYGGAGAGGGGGRGGSKNKVIQQITSDIAGIISTKHQIFAKYIYDICNKWNIFSLKYLQNRSNLSKAQKHEINVEAWILQDL